CGMGAGPGAGTTFTCGVGAGAGAIPRRTRGGGGGDGPPAHVLRCLVRHPDVRLKASRLRGTQTSQNRRGGSWASSSAAVGGVGGDERPSPAQPVDVGSTSRAIRSPLVRDVEGGKRGDLGSRVPDQSSGGG